MVNREEAERLLSGKGEDDLVEIDKFGNIWAHGTARRTRVSLSPGSRTRRVST